MTDEQRTFTPPSGPLADLYAQVDAQNQGAIGPLPQSAHATVLPPKPKPMGVEGTSLPTSEPTPQPVPSTAAPSTPLSSIPQDFTGIWFDGDRGFIVGDNQMVFPLRPEEVEHIKKNICFPVAVRQAQDEWDHLATNLGIEKEGTGSGDTKDENMPKVPEAETTE